MSSIITSILSSTVGLLWNKARDTTAKKYEHGDVTDAQLREIVVREMSDLKSKLESLSRKDLLCSYSFLQQGVEFLKVALDKSKEDEKDAVLNESSKDVSGATARLLNDVESDMLSEALGVSQAIEKLKINSNKEFETAEERFKDARKTATQAFWNEALRIEDRIFAAKVRVVSEIFEWFDNPEIALTGCLTSLRELHDLPAIREIFSVYLNGGMRAKINKEKRVENVKSVMLTNYVLFQLNQKFGRNFTNRLTWPSVIRIEDRSFNPIEDWQEVSKRKSWGDELIEHPKRLALNDIVYEQIYFPAANSRKEILFFPTISKQGCSYTKAIKRATKCKGNNDDITVISKTGECRRVESSKLEKDTRSMNEWAGLAVDNNDNVYAIRKVAKFKENRLVYAYVLYIFDESWELKHKGELDFLEGAGEYIMMAINRNNDIIFIKIHDPQVYVCDSNGKLKLKFQRPSLFIKGLSITDKNEIMIGSECTVDIYTEKGDMKSTIKLPEDHKVWSLAFHHAIGKIIVSSSLMIHYESFSHFLLCYSKAGELESSTPISDQNLRSVNLTSHPSGPVAVVHDRSITFL